LSKEYDLERPSGFAGGPFAATLTGGRGFSHEDGWFFPPPIFSFSAAQKKRKRAVDGPKEKKTLLRGTGARLMRAAQVRMTLPAA